MTSIRPTGPSLEMPDIKRSSLRPDPAMFRGLAISSSGLSAQRLRMEVASANLANLTSLVLSGARFAEPTNAALVASPHLARAQIYAGDRFLAR